METLISILRGINVSGQKKILMADLKALYEVLGFKNVVTYIQSGNVIFKTDSKIPNEKIAGQIEQAIYSKYQFHVLVIIRHAEEVDDILAGNPFLKEADIDTEKLHVTFLAGSPEHKDLESLKNMEYIPDRFIVSGKEVFLYCPVNYGETKLSNKFFESKLKVSATTRNWRTINKLAELAK